MTWDKVTISRCQSLFHDGITPVGDPSAYVHPSAVLIGDVIVARARHIGRAPAFEAISAASGGGGRQQQDTCMLHGFPGKDTVSAPKSRSATAQCGTAAACAAGLVG